MGDVLSLFEKLKKQMTKNKLKTWKRLEKDLKKLKQGKFDMKSFID
jgi:signal recognition particle GTPase